jgi:hypothetical protein
MIASAAVSMGATLIAIVSAIVVEEVGVGIGFVVETKGEVMH